MQVFCSDHSVHASFPQGCFGCSVVAHHVIKLDLSRRWSSLVSSKSGIILVRSFPSICWENCQNCVSVVSALSSSQKPFHYASFTSRAVCLNCSVLVSVAALSVGSGFGSVLPFCQFLTAAGFSVQAFSSHCPTMVAASCFFCGPFVLCAGFRLRSFDTVPCPDLSYVRVAWCFAP